jgi:hypothetical protein
LDKALTGLKKLQNYDGSFSWWKGMDGSPVMTAEVIEFLTRLNLLTSNNRDTKRLLDDAYEYLSKIVVKEVKEMKQREKEKKPVYIHNSHALQWVYLCAVGERKLSGDETMAWEYLMKHLEDQIRTQSMYAKALMSVVLFKNGQQQKAAEYLQSLMEYTVYTEEKGRYYDTQRAGYSWCDYRIPTQTAVIEALQIVNPADEKNINEMRNLVKSMPKTINESLDFSDEGNMYEEEEIPEDEPVGIEDEPDQATASEHAAQLIDDIRKKALRAMADLADTPEDENYIMLKKVWQMTDRKPEQQQQNQNAPVQGQPGAIQR